MRASQCSGLPPSRHYRTSCIPGSTRRNHSGSAPKKLARFRARVPRRKGVARALDRLSTASFREYLNLMSPSSGARVRTLVIVLNVISSLTSLAMAGLGWIVTMIARIPVPEQQDYRVIAYGVALMVTFSMAPVICVTASTKLARQDRRSSVLVSLVPAVLVTAAVVYFVWAGTYVPIR